MLYLYEIIFICNFDSKKIKPIHPPSKVWWFYWLNNHSFYAGEDEHAAYLMGWLVDKVCDAYHKFKKEEEK